MAGGAIEGGKKKRVVAQDASHVGEKKRRRATADLLLTLAKTIFCSTPSDNGAVGSESDAVINTACDGDEVGFRRSVVSRTASSSTPSDHGTVGTEADAVKIAAHDGDEVGIHRSVVALTVFRSTPSDQGAVGSESDAVKSSACDGDEVGIRRSVVALTEVRCAPSDHRAAGDTTSCQAAKRGGVVFVKRSYTTERVRCSRRECYGSSRSRERELRSARPSR